jgi:hypothetical protein
MKTKKPIFRLVALAALSLITGNELVAQTSVGSSCGCPNPVMSRTAANIVTEATTASVYSALPAAAYGGEITGNFTLTCDKLWTLDRKVYVAAGATLTIQPGTVIISTAAPTVAEARALIIERGGKIMAPGTVDCPIIFTASTDDLNGSLGIQDKGKWGGVLICGKATNNLTYAANGPFVAGQSGKLAVADGVGVLEGFASSIPQDQFGAGVLTAPAGFISATNPNPAGAYSFTAAVASAPTNNLGATALLTSVDVPTFLAGLNIPISGLGTAAGTKITTASSKTFGLSAATTVNMKDGYLLGSTNSTGSGATLQDVLTLTVANPIIEVGMKVTGTGIASNTTVSNISTNGLQITLSANATATMSGTYVFALPLPTGVTGTCVSGSTTIAIANAAIRPGMEISGTGIISASTSLSGNTVTTYVIANDGTNITLSQATTAALNNTALTFKWTTFTAGDITNCIGAKKITLASSNTALIAGQTITCSVTGLPSGTVTITSLNSATAGTTAIKTFSILNALTADISGGTITFNGVYPTLATAAFYPSSATQGTNMTLVPGSSPAAYVNFAGASVSPGTAGFDDNDNSGVMTYVSIRYSGANLLVGSEINGLTLASVGRGTKIENIEIVSCADDNIEIFGGTVNLKYCTTLFGNDDMYDYDLGWTGKAQFLFGMKANHFTTANGTAGSTLSDISLDSDHGFECDGDDNQSYNLPKSAPQIYNATIIGNDKVVLSADNTSLAAICAKENAGGTIANSIFANFRNGFNMKQSLGAASSYASGGEAWHNWTSIVASPVLASASTGNGTNILKVKCNTFVKNMTTGTPLTLSVNAGSSSGTALTGTTPGSDLYQFLTTDKNIEVASLTGFSTAFAASGSTVTTKNDVVPNVQTSVALDPVNGCPQAPTDGFFLPANYRGAFKPGVGNDNWLSDWTYSQVLGSTKGTATCPADINNDGIVNITDFGFLAASYGNSCN